MWQKTTHYSKFYLEFWRCIWYQVTTRVVVSGVRGWRGGQPDSPLSHESRPKIQKRRYNSSFQWERSLQNTKPSKSLQTPVTPDWNLFYDSRPTGHLDIDQSLRETTDWLWDLLNRKWSGKSNAFLLYSNTLTLSFEIKNSLTGVPLPMKQTIPMDLFPSNPRSSRINESEKTKPSTL